VHLVARQGDPDGALEVYLHLAAVEDLLEFLSSQQEGRHGRARERRRAA